uniref:FtsH protease activity modulator HflK n=1 Tax=Pararhizobium sp. IMCC3301 TaxID=3067904 RepID=UPI0027426C4B|nr:FtsH protease activity modulator HflK [Pararhizobium sp. IMCC3301]
MPWSNQTGGGSNGSGGPWGSGKKNDGPKNQGPWGGGQNGGGDNTPDLEDLIRRSQERLKQVLPGGGGSGGLGGANPVLIGFAALAILGFVLYNFFTFRVEPEQQGVVLRFGEMHRTTQPGLNFRLPYPLETVYTPSVTRVNRVDVGMRDNGPRSTAISDVPEESLMLTGDENIVDVDFAVFWVINNAADYLFNVKDADATVKAVAESAMREVVGSSDIQPILTQARQITEAAVQEVMQTTVDSYQSGILITQVQLLKVDPPSQVIDAFRDVQAARADAERSQNEAQAYLNGILPKARGEAARILENAAAYREQTIAEADGQADRFISIYEQYALAPEVTRKRMFLETMEKVYAGTNKVIIEENAGSGVVPYLPLNELNSQNKRVTQ